MAANFEGHKLAAAGGSSGIGRDPATDVVTDGNNVVIVDRGRDRVDETVGTLSKDGPAYGITAKLADRTQAARVQQRTGGPLSCPVMTSLPLAGGPVS